MACCNLDESSGKSITNAPKKKKSCSLSGFPLGVDATGNFSASGPSIDHEGQNFDNRLSSVKLQQKALVECLDASPFHVVVLYEKNFDHLSDSDIEHVETTLKTIIRMTILQKGEVMRFESTYHTECGWLSLICADDNTVNWILKQKISDHNGKRFRIIRKAEIPNNLSIVMKVPTKCTDIAQILEVLTFQNDGLFIDEWKVFKKCTVKGKNGESYTRIASTIPPKAIPFLHQVDWKPYYEFSRAVVVSNVPVYGHLENPMFRPRKESMCLTDKAQKSSDSDAQSLVSDESEPEINEENNQNVTSISRKSTSQNSQLSKKKKLKLRSEPESLNEGNNQNEVPAKRKNICQHSQHSRKKIVENRIKEEITEECTMKIEVIDSRENIQNSIVSLISDDEERYGSSNEEVTVKQESVDIDKGVQKVISLISDDDEEENYFDEVEISGPSSMLVVYG